MIKYQNALGEEGRVIEDAGILQRLLNKHTGRLEDIYSMVEDYSPEPLSVDRNIKEIELRR